MFYSRIHTHPTNANHVYHNQMILKHKILCTYTKMKNATVEKVGLLFFFLFSQEIGWEFGQAARQSR